MPVVSAQTNAFTRKGRLLLLADGRLEGEIKEQYRGSVMGDERNWLLGQVRSRWIFGSEN